MEEPIMKCPHCHATIDDDSVFCPSCGKVVEVKCPKCGKTNVATAKFCKYCGEQLAKQEEVKKEEKPKKDRKASASRVLSIVAMSVMVFAMVLLFGVSFAPLLNDSFFPATSFTVIGYVVDAVIRPGFDTLNDAHDYLPLINSAVLLGLLTAIMVLSIIGLAKGIPALVKSIKEKKYTDLSKYVITTYVLFVILFVYFRGFAFSENLIVTTVNDDVMAVIIVVLLLLAFNFFTKEFNNEKHDLGTAIFRAASRVVMFIFLLVILMSVGGQRYTVQVSALKDNLYGMQTEQQLFLADAGSLGVISILIKSMQECVYNAVGILVAPYVFLGIQVVLEFVILAFAGCMFKSVFSQDLSKPAKNKKLIAFAIVVLALSITNLVMQHVANAALNKIDSLEAYGIRVYSTMFKSLPITMVVFGTLLLANSIVTSVMENKKGAEVKNEEAK